MIKLLVADDEYLVLDSIKMIINKNVENVSVVGTASTGREAIEKAIRLKPDVVFMDIHMPGIDGIEAIKQIKNANSDIFFVILTAYEYFDYAKEALNLGVFEYLLKPINKNKLIETLKNIGTAIDKKRDSLMKGVELTERINSMLPFLESQYVTQKLYSIGLPEEMKFYENIFNISLKHGYAMTLLIQEDMDNIKKSQEKQRLYDLFSIKLKCKVPCLVGNPLSDRIIAFIPTDKEKEGNDSRRKSQELAKGIAEKMKGMTNLNYRIGIGRSYDAASFNKSCNEAYMAAATSNGQTVIHYENISISKISENNYPQQLESAFSNSMIIGNANEAKEIFEEIYLWLANNYEEDIDRIKAKLINLLSTLERTMLYRLECFNELKQNYILSILRAKNKEEIRIQFVELLWELSHEIQNQRKNEVDGIISKLLEYLNSNYSKDISLNNAAKQVNLSYHYLSKIFKDEIGKSFTDYLTELRIGKSIKLLGNQSLSIKEICLKIGYNDPNYYAKAFKKITGMSPTEYRSSINMRGDYIG